MSSALTCVRNGRAERRLLHVAVARAHHAARRERDLHQTRAIKTERGLATPQIGRAEKPFRHRDEIRLVIADRLEMRGRHIASALRHREAILDTDNSKLRAERQRFERRQLDRRPGKHQRPQRGDFVGR